MAEIIKQFNPSDIDPELLQRWGIYFDDSNGDGKIGGEDQLNARGFDPAPYNTIMQDFANIAWIANRNGYALKLFGGKEHFYILEDELKDNSGRQEAFQHGDQGDQTTLNFLFDRVYTIDPKDDILNEIRFTNI